MSYKLYAENIELKPRETKVVKFPWGYFKRTPVINLSSTSNVIISVDESTKNYSSSYAKSPGCCCGLQSTEW